MIPDTEIPLNELPLSLRNAVLESSGLRVEQLVDLMLVVRYNKTDMKYDVHLRDPQTETRYFLQDKIVKELAYWLQK